MIILDTIFSIIIVYFIAKFITKPLIKDSQVSLKEKYIPFVLSSLLVIGINLALRYILGFLGFMVATEAQQLMFYLIGSLFFLLLLYFTVKKKELKILLNPLIIVFLTSFISSYLMIIIWYLINKGFPQPMSVW